MKRKFDLVCFFGYCPHFPVLVQLCEELNIDYAIIYGPRQSSSIDKLNLPPNSKKLCITSLQDISYKELRIESKLSLGFSYGAPFIFSNDDIDKFKGWLINSHGAPLPEFKGGGGFTWRILQSDRRGCCLVHLISPEIDEGLVLFKTDFKFDRDERFPCEYIQRQLNEEQIFLVPWLKQVIVSCEFPHDINTFSEHEAFQTYFPRLNTSHHGYIDWRLSLDDLEAFILAFSKPYPGASTFVKGIKVKILNCYPFKSCPIHPFIYGLILHMTSENIFVASNGGILKIPKRDLVLGESSSDILKNGDRFFTPPSYLEKAFLTRTYFSASGNYERSYMKSSK